ncbi:MAG: glycosyltransferase family 4 protein [candidate division WOR-3 bacterium]
MDKKLRILVITTAFPRHKEDIITPWLVKEMKLLIERGFEVKVFTSSYKGLKQKRFENIEIYRFRYAPKPLEKLTHDAAVPILLREKKIYKLLVIPYLVSGTLHALFQSLREKFDIVYVQWPIPHVLFALPYKLVQKSKIVLYFHGSDAALLKKLSRPLFWLFSSLCSNCEVTLTNSNYMKNSLINLGIRNRIEVIPLANPHTSELEPYKEEKELNILFVGRLIDLKGVDVLIKSFKIIKEKYANAKLTIVGDGILINELKKLTKLLDLNDVYFKGFLTGEPLHEEYRKAMIFVLPSIVNKSGETEGLGMVLVEAISFGVPVVGSNVGGIPDIILDGKTGLLANPGDPEDLANKIIKLIENPELRKKLVEEGQKHIKENYSWDATLNKLEKIFKEVVKKEREK